MHVTSTVYIGIIRDQFSIGPQLPWPPTQSFWTFSRPSLLSQAAICHVCVMYRIQEIYRTAPRLPAGCNAVLGLEVSKNTVATNAILVKLGFGMIWGSSYDHPMIRKTSGGRHPMRRLECHRSSRISQTSP